MKQIKLVFSALGNSSESPDNAHWRIISNGFESLNDALTAAQAALNDGEYKFVRVAEIRTFEAG